MEMRPGLRDPQVLWAYVGGNDMSRDQGCDAVSNNFGRMIPNDVKAMACARMIAKGSGGFNELSKAIKVDAGQKILHHIILLALL